MTWAVSGEFPDELAAAREAVDARIRGFENEAVRNLCAADIELAFNALSAAVGNGSEGGFEMSGMRDGAGRGHVSIDLIFER